MFFILLVSTYFC